MQTVEFAYGPKLLHLYLSGSAHFKLQALLPRKEGEEAPDLVAQLIPNTQDANHLLMQTVGILAEAGELCRRYLGHEPERIPEPGELEALLSPMQMIQLKGAALKAIDNGYRSEDPESEQGDVDIGLAELEKKTKRSPRLPI